MPDQPPLLHQLVQRTQAAITAADRERAARHLLDWSACRAAGSRLPEARSFAGAVLDADRIRPAAAALDLQTPAMAAALIDGALGCTLEMDDVHRAAVLHPGPVVIPAALAAARSHPVTVAGLLDAILQGYEVMIRIGRALGLSHYRHWHPTSTCGAFGAAAAAAAVFGLDPERTVWALANAGSRTGGLWQMRHEAVPTKALHMAQAAHSGWLAARLAVQGFSGPSRLLEGAQGLFAATSAGADLEPLLAAAPHWLMHEVSFKPWPACRHAHPAIDALLALDALPAPTTVAGITVGTYAAAIDFCDQPAPRSAGEARFSIQHALASILTRGRPCLAHYADEALADSAIHALRQRIKLQTDPDINHRFPNHFGARVEVLLTSGERLHGRVADAWGDPERPLADQDLATKAEDLLHFAGLDHAQCQAVIQQTLALTARSDEPALAVLREAWA